jgi:hypothetical protein
MTILIAGFPVADALATWPEPEGFADADADALEAAALLEAGLAEPTTGAVDLRVKSGVSFVTG